MYTGCRSNAGTCLLTCICNALFLKERYAMKPWSSRLMLAVGVGMVMLLIGIPWAGPAVAQAPATPPSGQNAGVAFKNVTTSTLKGLTVSDFLGSMGVMAAALGYDCADCHFAAGTDKVNWEFDTPKKKTARRMVE